MADPIPTEVATLLYQLLEHRTDDQTQVHNLLAPFCSTAILQASPQRSDQFVILESVILGVLAHHYPDPRRAGEILDTMTARVIERIGGTRG